MSIDPKTYHFLDMSQEVTQLCKPIFELIGISYFDWLRAYSDGQKARLTSYPQWSEHYYKNGYYKVSKLERHPGLYRSGMSVWDFQKKPDESPFGYAVHNDMCENFNRDHGLSIHKVNPNYMDCFIFTTTKNNSDINEKYLAHMEEIQKFTDYFQNSGAKLISKAEKNKIPRLIDHDTFEAANGSSLLLNSDVKKYSDMIKLDKISVVYHDKIFTLSPRQTQCLIQLAQGKLQSEIAQNLNLTLSAVALYIANIKQKTGCSKLSELFCQVKELL